MVFIGYMPDTHGGPYEQPEPDSEHSARFAAQLLQEAEQAERCGFDGVFVPERHARTECMFPAPLTLLAALAARTQRVRLGSYVIMPPLYDPVHLAEEAAMIDLLSRGRLILGLGVGYHPRYFNHFGVPVRQREGRFEESLEVMRKAWTSDVPWSHRGKYWQFDNVVVEPPTAQKPHPPLWMGAGSAASIRKVAALGFNLLLDQYASIEQIGERIAIFKTEVETRGRVFDPMNVGVTRSINIVTTPADLERAMANRVAGRRRIDRLATRPDGPGSNRAQLSDAEICASALYGTPDEVGRMMQSLRAAGAEYVLLNSAGGRPTLRRFAQELMPAFSDAAPVAADG